jgi:hypothetical protein
MEVHTHKSTILFNGITKEYEKRLRIFKILRYFLEKYLGFMLKPNDY